ncbi:MAG: MBL fold metallo-hydrolase [Bacteroidetes bacterium CG12_big_fil_rev_8_21_14_0_65_60_17]|nr:MAG: MBL fold metallo-hydrolase [Bacteroidetes bacterium CG12_big_fil_rev_8_21_14_0_65_60_17]
MTVRSFTCNPFQTNGYLVDADGEVVVIDPSCMTDEEINHVVRLVEIAGGALTAILLTHAHIDHIFGVQALVDRYGVDVHVHGADEPLLSRAAEQAALFGMDLTEPRGPFTPLVPGVPLRVGDRTWDVLHTPGHSPGSVTFVDQTERMAFSGDVLFMDSIGRTDLWQGSLPILMESIFQQLAPLGSDMQIFPGHGDVTTVGRELAMNPFLTDSAA